MTKKFNVKGAGSGQPGNSNGIRQMKNVAMDGMGKGPHIAKHPGARRGLVLGTPYKKGK